MMINDLLNNINQFGIVLFYLTLVLVLFVLGQLLTSLLTLVKSLATTLAPLENTALRVQKFEGFFNELNASLEKIKKRFNFFFQIIHVIGFITHLFRPKKKRKR